jgi:HEAT repeat protein
MYDRQSLDNPLNLLTQARVRAILFALSQVKSSRKKAEINSLLESYLEDSRPNIVAEAIDGLRYQKAKKYNIRVLSLLNHPSPFVRGSVLRFWAALYPEQALPILLRSLSDIDPIVRENAADELGDLGDTAAIAPLKDLLEKEEQQNVRESIETALEGLLD